MRILFISAANNIHTVRWVNSLVERGHEVHLAYNKNHSPKYDQINKKVTLHELNNSGNLAYYLNSLQLRRIFKKIKPDIVNAHYASGYGTLARVSRMKPLVLSVWGSDVYDFPYESKIKMKIIKRNLAYATIIASTSKCMAIQTKKILQDVNIEITPFGVDINKFIINKEKNVSNKFVFGIVKTLKYKYGIEFLIKAFRIVVDRIEENNLDIDVELKIFGEGDLETELKELCIELDLKDKVSFEGYICNDKVPLVMNNMDVFCLSSILDSESFGVAAVEAMACGLPVIASDVDGFKEVIADNETGYIVPRQNSIQLADKMYKLICNKEIAHSMGKNGRKRVEKLYNWENNVTTMERVYKSLINKI